MREVPLPEPDMLIECKVVGQQFRITSVPAIQAYGDARVRAALEEAIVIAENHYIPGHSVAGPWFAKQCADAIRKLMP